jgi:hypothetical protein
VIVAYLEFGKIVGFKKVGAGSRSSRSLVSAMILEFGKIVVSGRSGTGREGQRMGILSVPSPEISPEHELWTKVGDGMKG